MKKDIHIGCSSFYNAKWKKVFYPEDLPSKKWFDYYCTQFSAFEINATFYKFPTATILKNWYAKCPDHFTYAVKVPKEITHTKKLKDCKEQIDTFYTICESHLKEKLGCFLFQLPPSFIFSEENLEQVLSNLNTNFKNVIEFRHQSWWNDEAITTLSKNNISFCSVSHPSLPEKIIIDSPLIYVRLHGRGKMYYSEYTIEELKTIEEILTSNTTKETYLFFNNTASEAGIVNAMEMKNIMNGF
ncbi:uncharacterized protein YecE (DUF72 family) [Flavobacterium sp. 7E]|uniref:DUF72 domain-containing protein n=1 Tax=Flavobacterium sp. 7E TaxID=2735898 RepID=UPI0015705B24|nr:DUF72 domain-containing protein [Flavobacterium sp. 7E]NRS89537.1 uncharacterized protein YecE (DUF72 family) [Flavobacterium sp. 7E]